MTEVAPPAVPRETAVPSPGPRWRARIRDFLAYLFILASTGVSLVGFVWLGRHALAIRRLSRGVGDTVFYTRDGRPWFRLDEYRRDASLAQIAPQLRQAVVSIEDHRFYRHPGIDAIGLGRAMYHNVRERRWVEGGSTITQQLARTLFLSTNRTAGRKAKEAVLALMLEMQLSKDEILELYLNRVYLGARVYGVQTMSERCFGKKAKDVSLAEAALIAGVIQSPAHLSPWTNLEGARGRSRRVLARMREEGYIDAAAEAQARSARLRVGPPPSMQQARWGYAKEYLRQVFADQISGDHPPEWRVDTTFSPELQDAAEAAVASGVRRLRLPGLQAALVAIEPSTGDVLAMVGGVDARASPFNRAARSRRQPGSAFKPFVYAAALERGYSPVSMLDDLHAVTVAGREEWSPRNVHESPDRQSLREALLQSNNQAAVALQQKIGTGAVLKVAKNAGLDDMPDVPSLALGSGLVSPLDLTAAYAIFPNGGYAVQPRGILRVTNDDGEIVFEDAPRLRRVLSEPAAFQTLTMLQDVIDRGTASAARELRVNGPAGGKTGTTNDFMDAWFVGFTSSVVVGVWVGFDQPAPIGKEAYGATVALPIWADFIRRTERRLPAEEFEVPPGMTEMNFCRMSYRRAVAECPTYTEYFKDGDDIPGERCPLHQGSLQEKLERVLDKFFENLGKRLRRILK
jgi:1A family penicillin-binding protein